METNIKSNEIDKEKLRNIVLKGKNKCPLLETLKLAGVKIESKINYLWFLNEKLFYLILFYSLLNLSKNKNLRNKYKYIYI